MKNLTANVNTLRNLSALALMMLGLLLWLPVQVEAGTIQRISLNNNGEEANGNSTEPFISDNGRFVAFKSEASNLVEGDTNEVADIFVYDLLEHKIERVSVDSNGNEAFPDSDKWGSSYPSINADGRYVAFKSAANNLVKGDINNTTDVFVHDRENAITRLVSFAIDDNYDVAGGHLPMISANGKYVVFKSINLTEQTGIFLHDLDLGGTAFIKYCVCYTDGDLSISGDGQFIAFPVNPKKIGFSGNDYRENIFVYDRLKDITTRVPQNIGNEPNASYAYPKISTNGKYVVFSSSSSNLVANDTNSESDIFVHDLQASITTRVSVDNDGNQSEKDSFSPSISGNGRYVVFASYDYTLAGKYKGSQTGKAMYIHDMQTGKNTFLSYYVDGKSSISGDGRYIAFTSKARNLVENDTNGVADIFVYDRGAGSNATISGVIKPKVYITTNSYLYSKESPYISVYVSTDVEVAEMTEELYDIYVAVGGPDELALFDPGQGILGLTPKTLPYADNVTVMESDWVETFNYEFTEDAPAGNYFVHIGVLDQKDSLISEDSVDLVYDPDYKDPFLAMETSTRSSYERTNRAGIDGINYIEPNASLSDALKVYYPELKQKLKIYDVVSSANDGLNLLGDAGGIISEYVNDGKDCDLDETQRDFLLVARTMEYILNNYSIYKGANIKFAGALKEIYKAENQRLIKYSSALSGSVFLKFEHVTRWWRVGGAGQRNLKVEVKPIFYFPYDWRGKIYHHQMSASEWRVYNFEVQSKKKNWGDNRHELKSVTPGAYSITATDTTNGRVYRTNRVFKKLGETVTITFDYDGNYEEISTQPTGIECF